MDVLSALVVAFGSLVVAVGWPLAPWAIGLIFERGAFHAQDTEAVAHVLRYGLPCADGEITMSLLLIHPLGVAR